MGPKIRLVELGEIQEMEPSHPEVEALMGRLMEIEPVDMARALYHIESRKEFPQIYLNSPGLTEDQTEVYFSRGLKDEIEDIYLELAKHLRKNSQGSTDLMNAVFDFFSQTLNSLVEVPFLFSNN